MYAASKAIIDASPGAMDLFLIFAVVLFLVAAVVCWLPPTKNVILMVMSVGMVFITIALMFLT